MADPAPEQARILLVDDQAENLLALRSALERPDYELVEVSSGKAALGALLRQEVAVILLDVMMPGLDGFETAALIRERERARQIPIIFVTGVMADVAAVFRGYAAGAVDYLVKPLDTNVLRAKVAVFVALWRQQREIGRTSEALRQAESRERMAVEALYDVTFEEAPIGIGHATEEGRWVRVNSRLAEILGRPRSDVLRLSLEDVVAPVDRAALLENVRRVVAGSEPRHRGEYRFQSANGASVWIALTMSLIRAADGAPVGLALLEDISEEKRLAHALEESEQRFARLREAGLIGVFHEAPDGRITEANGAFLKIVGYSAEEVRAGALVAASLVSPSSADAEAGARQELREAGLCATHETEYIRKDGSRACVLVGAVAAAGGGIVGFALDITATKQAERERSRLLGELQESVRVREDFLYIASHELRNPLTPLLLQVKNLRGVAMRATSPIDPAWLARQLEPAERATLRLARLVESLLDVSRLTVGRVPLEPSECDLDGMARDVVERMRSDIERAGCSVTVRAGVRMQGRWDRARIEEVIGHLLSNALKYGAGRPVEIDVEGDERVARVSVTDHGVGVAPQDAARIFERFARAAPIHHYGGFGLGLWIVRRIVEAHRGRVELSSQPGEGASFAVTLPRRGPAGPTLASVEE